MIFANLLDTQVKKYKVHCNKYQCEKGVTDKIFE
jgi:hypothetical protein